MSVPLIIRDLVERFERNLEAYKSGAYNETQVRREFIDPFFEALGWDVNNAQGYAEAYKDVIHEDAVKVGGVTKAPDYSFRIGGTRKFFVEAKKPSIQIKDDPAPAFQVRRYAWSAKLPLSIVTDFEELAVYDCRVKPDQKDKADKARITYYTFRQYLDKWDEIAAIFSRDAILKGSFDKYAESHKAKRGTTEVDSAFLEEIESWRDTLAKNIALRNTLSVRELNEAVQRTIDRIIFLRIAEDRGIEEYGSLRSICNGPNTFNRLRELFYKADDRYNSGLFHFRFEKGEAEPPDSLTISLNIDDKPLKEILKRLYYPDSPYEFAVLPADILGQVYEQFLGKVIRLTSDHRAVVEDKPEVKKAGGVFYTPTYIVEYIVQNTVGKLLNHPPTHLGPRGSSLESKGGGAKAPLPSSEAVGGPVKSSPPVLGGVGGGKPLTPAEASKLRILDPACGSGSFLLGAYQYLLDWHLKWYADNDPEKWAKQKEPRICSVGAIPCVRPPLGGDGSKGDHKDAPLQINYRLTTAERKRILLNNIYGVDIDSQAVEVTKLSLLLKVLEGETVETLNQQMRLFHERALPDLGSNIKCGNSLIGPDFYDGKQMNLMADEEMYRVNVFDWQREFAHVFNSSPFKGEAGRGMGSSGGFDAVIGNPPYIRIQALKEWAPKEVEFYKESYQSAQKGNYDIYVVFVEKGLQLLNKNGRLGYILPHKFFNAQYGEPLRKHLAEGQHLADIVHFGDKQIFANATTYTCLLFLERQARQEFGFEKVDDLEGWRLNSGASGVATIPAASVTASEWNFNVGPGSMLFERLAAMPVKLEQATSRIFQGLKTSADKIYIVQEIERSGTQVKVFSPEKQAEYWLEPELLHPLVKGGESRRYALSRTKRLILFPYRNGAIISGDELKSRYPLTWRYLLDNRQYLENRENGKMRTERWYGYVYPKALEVMSLPKLFTPDIAPESRYSLDESGEAFFTGGAAGGYGILPALGYTLHWLLAMLNSKLLEWYLKQTATQMRGGWYSFEARFIRNLPIIPVPESPTRIPALVEQMLALQKQLPEARTGHDQTHLQRQIDATDRQIDKLVYELYGLTEEEIGVVES